MYTASGVLCAGAYMYTASGVLCAGAYMYTASGVLCAEEHGALCIQQVVCCVPRNMVHYVYSKWCVVC